MSDSTICPYVVTDDEGTSHCTLAEDTARRDQPRPAEVFPPHEFLRDEMVERGWDQAELARRTGRSRPFVSRAMRGAYPIGPRFALDLERATGVSAETWCRLQADYAVWTERQRQTEGKSHGPT